MMTTKGNLAPLLIAITVFGFFATLHLLAASPQEGVGTPSLPGTRVEYIADPSMNNMNAIAVTIPETWHFQGVLFQAGKTPAAPYFVFRASSPDGLSFVEHLPRLCWIWGWGPRLQDTSPACLHIEETMKAQEFLQHLAAMLKVEYVADDPVPADVQAEAQKALSAEQAVWAPKYAAAHLRQPQQTREVAWAKVRYNNGTFPMKGWLGTMVDCVETDYPGRRPMQYMPGVPPSEVHRCDAGVRYLVAPEAQYEAVKKLWDVPGMGGRDLAQWDQAMNMRVTQWGENVRAQQNQMAAIQMQAQQQQFEHAQAVQLQMHNQFLATMQHGTDLSMAREQAGMNARSTAASDWVDYSLNQRTVLDPGTGQLTKVSSAYTYTWVDSTGQHSYQTNDPNANPNATMTGNWTKQQMVHGDGSQ